MVSTTPTPTAYPTRSGQTGKDGSLIAGGQNSQFFPISREFFDFPRICGHFAAKMVSQIN